MYHRGEPIRVNMDEQNTLDLYKEYIQAFESKDYNFCHCSTLSITIFQITIHIFLKTKINLKSGRNKVNAVVGFSWFQGRHFHVKALYEEMGKLIYFDT